VTDAAQPAVLSLPCTTCGAQPGEGCRTRSGANTGPHSARRADAEEHLQRTAAARTPDTETPPQPRAVADTDPGATHDLDHAPRNGEPVPGCPACDAQAAAAAAPLPYLIPLPDTLTAGLTVWGDYGGAQIRLEPAIALDDNGQMVFNDDGTPVIVEGIDPRGALYLATKPDALAGHEGGGVDDDGNEVPPTPVWRLDRDAARALRDLLNIATARGTL
jgi:hypothetical protein